MKIQKIIFALCVAILAAWNPILHADQTQKLGTCLTDALTGKERKELVKWIYFAMATHPELEANAAITDAERLESHKGMGALVTRLFVEDCPEEARQAQKSNPMAIQRAFEFVGQVAMQELMTHPNVMQDVAAYVQHSDQSKINALFVE